MSNAPGKVLLVGGYLVLEREYSGLVVALSAKFIADIDSLYSDDFRGRVHVRSPQFLDGSWMYMADIGNDRDIVLKETDGGANPYIEIALRHTLLLAISQTGVNTVQDMLRKGIVITIQADNDFYSQRNQLKRMGLPLTIRSLQSIPQYSPLLSNIKEVHKTGLGSSAAMVTSLISAILSYFNVIPKNNRTKNDLEIVHKISQFCHCLAQGKIGSGFDVSSAVFGSHIYKRFSPSIFAPLMTKENISCAEMCTLVYDTPWDHEIIPFQLPRGLRIMLGEVDTGSSTPSMVSKVLSWKKNNPVESSQLWTKLNSMNTEIINLFQKLKKLETTDGYDQKIDDLSIFHHSKWNAKDNVITEVLIGISSAFLALRAQLRYLSKVAEVPIEPESQTSLLDSCLECPGILCAGVPGAGGYDAIFVITLGTRTDLIEEQWRKMNVGPLLCQHQDAFITER